MDSNNHPGGRGGFGSIFGGSPGYPHTDLAGVPLTGMSTLSPYLNVDPRYLTQDSSEEFILPTGANKTRGRFELAFFTIGGCCITGAAFGAFNGLRLGLNETQNMVWSKPKNVQLMNMVTRQGAMWANTLGSLALLYSAFGVLVEKTRGAEDDLNTMVAGTMTGMMYKSPVYSWRTNAAKGNVTASPKVKYPTHHGLFISSVFSSTPIFARNCFQG
ncbi:mitochondrial import inner membrane translocase subunit Tim23-like isoform X1 [Rana temporaria]|uniref:mitochondrial import inner membrane translocase subunit Tim23-like isoform X1 n=1 Tax=Rana temporaria TaxID=8407 RepID=UPI001AADBA00|nr:mitochondrial import inner membrane translocase subunit Tim23-like isoform X1 [Rana temporaria]